MSDEELFDLGDGLPLSDVIATITNAEAVFDTEYSADAVVVAFTFEPHEDGAEPQRQLYSVGKGFEPLDGGESVGHTSGKHVKISKQSNYGRWMRAAQECEDFADAAREHGASTHELMWWIGSVWHLTTDEYEVRNPSKPDQPAKMRTIIIPDEFHGYTDEDEAPAPKSTAKKTVAKKTTAKKTTAKKTTAKATTGAATVEALLAEEGGEELIEELQALAAECEDHDTFMEQAMDLEGVAGNRVAEKAVMSSKPGSIWADRES